MLLRRLNALHSAVCAPEPSAAGPGKALATGDTFQSRSAPGAAEVEIAPFNSRRSPLVAMHGAAASSQPLVAEVGMRIMKAGGNCVDAAIAMAAAINMAEPTGTGIGGDCFCLYYDAKTGSVEGMNASGRAPAGLSIDVMKKTTGRVFPDPMPRPGEDGCHHLVTVPGACAGWCDAVEKWGTMDMATVLEPAITMGEEGYPIHKLTAVGWRRAAALLNRMPNGHEMLTPDDSPGAEAPFRGPFEGEIWYNKNLAATFREVAANGKDGYYKGRIGKEIVKVLAAMGGVMTEEDLANHYTTFPTPISTNYRGVEVWEIPPNGQGLAGLIALNILEGYDVRAMGHNSPQLLHTMIEAMRLSFADAQKYIADSDWEREQALPTEALLSKDYAAERRALIDPQFAFDDVTFGTPANSSGTIYFCVADPYGNACSFINSNFAGVGTGIVPEGCGFTLQNRGGNFVLDPTHPNALEGGKRPYHTIIPGMATTPKHQGGGKEQPQDFYAAFGVMGGFMQPQGHMQVISNMVDFGMDPQAALDADRFQVAAGNQSDLSKGVLVTVEEGISESTVQDLIKRGHNVSVVSGSARQSFGRGQIIRRHPKYETYWAGSDPRADGCDRQLTSNPRCWK